MFSTMKALHRVGCDVLQGDQAGSEGSQTLDHAKDTLLVKVLGQESHELVVANSVVTTRFKEVNQQLFHILCGPVHFNSLGFRHQVIHAAGRHLRSDRPERARGGKNIGPNAHARTGID